VAKHHKIEKVTLLKITNKKKKNPPNPTISLVISFFCTTTHKPIQHLLYVLLHSYYHLYMHTNMLTNNTSNTHVYYEKKVAKLRMYISKNVVNCATLNKIKKAHV